MTYSSIVSTLVLQTSTTTIPVDSVMCGLHTRVYLQDGLVIHIGLTVALQGFIGHGPAQERFEGEGLQLQRSDWDNYTP